VRIAPILEADLPEDAFDAVFASNLLEHFATPSEIAVFLDRMKRLLKPGGVIALMGPNFRYCAKEYFDCADHVLALTHVSAAEHLYGAGFDVQSITPRFLPYSFRSRLPASATLTRAYLRAPAAWRLLGKQFLVLGRRPMEEGR
jgi:SAM-dependent methyltransferase